MAADRARCVVGIVVLGLLCGGGCFRVHPPDGRYVCDPGVCPVGYQCASDHTCRRSPLTVRDMAMQPQPSEDMSSVAQDMATPIRDDMSPMLSDGGISCPIVYVSTSAGDDGNSGCNSSRPKRSIGGAMAMVRADTHEIHVCRGKYTEPGIALSIPLLGGYDCGSWQRTPTYGYPTFDGVNETVVEVAAQTGVSVMSGTVVLDGLTIQLDATGQTGITRTISLAGGDTQISSCKIQGATTPGQSAQSNGIAMSGGANVELSQCMIDGGAGASSVGVFIADGSYGKVHVANNVINGGTGNSGYIGAMGMIILGNALTIARGTAVENNVINGGAGNAVMNGTYASVGIEILDSSRVEILHNQIDGGIGNGVNSSVGIHRAGGSSGALQLSGNRIYGGSTPGATFH